MQDNECQPVTADTFGDLYDCPRPESASPHQHPPLRSSFMSGFSGNGINSWLLIGGAATGVAAALAGGGGGSSSSTAPGIRSSDPGYTGGITGQGDITSPSFYQTSEYLQRADLDVIKAKEAYANIAALNSANGAVQGGGGITIAILDTGVDPTHQDLAGNILIPCETGLPCREHYALSDPSGHGTHVAGIAAAEKNTSGIHGAMALT